MPLKVLTSKNDTIKGWEIIEEVEEYLTCSGSSPDEARQKLINLAISLNISGFINMEYFKTQGNDGNYVFSIHHYRGIPVSIARRSIHGQYSFEEIPVIQENVHKYLGFINEGRQSDEDWHSIITVVVMSIFFLLLIFFFKR